MKLSVVIPARNEEGSVTQTLKTLTDELRQERIDYEILVVDDGSSDSTGQKIQEFSAQDQRVVLVENRGRHGFGCAVRCGLDRFSGDCVAVMMADCSDSPKDLVRYFRRIEAGADCVFGSRFVKGGQVVDYPPHKLFINRIANWFVKRLFNLKLNDTTNAFKIYRREVIEAMQPLISPHFNLTVEMPLKAIVRGFQYEVIPISWTNRQYGVSKLKLAEMGSRYAFIVLYLWLEKALARGDYHRQISPRLPESAIVDRNTDPEIEKIRRT
jgi:dolichol-phosphate mannosyltransferase